MKIKIMILGGPTFTIDCQDKTAEQVHIDQATACTEKRPWVTPEGSMIGCNILNSAVTTFDLETGK